MDHPDESTNADRALERKNKRKRVATLILSVFSLLSLLTAITYSWFINSDLEVSSTTDVGVMNAPIMYLGSVHDGKVEWGGDLNIQNIQDITPLCGDGTHFFTPSAFAYTDEVYTDAGGEYKVYNRKPTAYAEVDEETVSGSVYTVDIAMRSALSGPLYLDPDSALSPSEQSVESPYLPGVSTGNIAGAMRVAIFQKTGTEYDLKCVWIPNAAFQYDAKKKTFTENGNPEGSYLFVSQVDAPFGTEINTAEYPNGYAVIDEVLYVWDLAKCNAPFSSYTSGTNEYRVVVWVDGTDRECVDALSGGRVDLHLGIRIEGQ